jgi:PAS domain S-box-containing protein
MLPVTGAYPSTAPVWRSPPEPARVSQARRFVQEALTGAASEVIDTATLLVTELVTNAMLHAGSEVEVRLWANAKQVHVRVSDAAPDRGLIPRRLDHDASIGRGLQLVHALAAAHGVEVTETGKTVWFELWPGIANRPDSASDWSYQADDDVAGMSVLLPDVPIGLFRAAQRHRDALLRECKLLVVSGERLPGVSADDLRSAQAAHDLITRGVVAEIERALQDDPSAAHVSARMVLPETCREGLRVLATTLERANGAARSATFLTRPALPEIREFRRWMIHQILTQLDGRPPTSWESWVPEDSPAPRALDQNGAALHVDRSAPIIIAGDDNIIIGAGRSIADLLGWNPEDLVGRRIVTVIPPRLRMRHVTGFTNFLLSGESHIIGTPVPVEALHRDGHEVPVELHLRVEQSREGRPLFVATLRPRHEQ